MAATYQVALKGEIADNLRSVFSKTPSGSRSPSLPFIQPIAAFNKNNLPATMAIIKRDNQSFEPFCQANVVFCREVNDPDPCAYRGFLELTSEIHVDNTYNLNSRKNFNLQILKNAENSAEKAY
ncbi:MAG: hypothetical protein HQM08_09680 [Candidatus Riflebacteria bacterium]|nr:hypothetical protein [Candidatus Riflebacteria bacterium]